MEGQGINGRTVGTGVTIAQQASFTWELENLDIVLKNDCLINSQKIDFTIGGTPEKPHEWSVYFQAEDKNHKRGMKLVYIRRRLTSSNNQNGGGDAFYSQLFYAIKDYQGVTILEGESDVNMNLIMNNGYNGPWETSGRIDIEKQLLLRRKRWSVQITLNLYSSKKQTDQDGTPTLEQFQEKSIAKAREDLGMLLQNPVEGDVKVVSSDGKEFTVPRGILTVRSPIFEAMLRTDMTEAKDGIIKLPDISGKTLGLLLHFLYTGELLQDWKETGVILELTNAAAKYQLTDLLEFLDLVLGRFCDLENVAPLLTLANQLGLKRAEKELLKFIGEEGVNSTQNFLQIMKVISGMDSTTI